MPPSVLVLYNQPVLPHDHPEAPSEYDVLDTVADTVKVLKAAGFEVRKLGISLDPAPLLEELKTNRPDAIFNLFEGVATRTSTEVSVAAFLEWLDIPFCGCPSLALALGRDKIRTKHLLTAVGLPTPHYQVVERLPVPTWTGTFPAIVKPALQDASVGIDQASVVTNREELDARSAYVFRTYSGPVLIEQFVSGREFHVHVIEDGNGSVIVLPPAEIAFKPSAAMAWPVYTYAAKWHAESEEYKASPLLNAIVLPPGATRRLEEIARGAWSLLGCRDFARLDVRMAAEEEAFYILEMNPNPYLNSLALVKGLEAIGRTLEQFIVQMTSNTIARGGIQVPTGTISIPVGVVTPSVS